MKTKKNLLSYALSLCLVTLCSIAFWACSNEELDAASVTTILNLKVTNNTGYSTGDLLLEPSGTSIGNIRIDLKETKIEVTPDKLGTVRLTGQTNPEVTDEPTETSMRRHGTKNFSFSDGQTAAAVWNYLYETAALNHWELTDVQFVDYEAERVSDDMVRITLNFDVICQLVGKNTDVKSFTMSPSYYQYVKGAKVDDTAIVTTDDQIGGSSADVTAIDVAFTAKAWLKLAQTSITVKKDQFGKVSLSQAGTPQGSTINKTDSIGEQITFADSFADSQRASITLRNAHHKNAEFYYSITELKYIDYTVTTVSDKQCLITLHYRGTYVHSNGTKRGTFDLYPKYYQILEEEQPQPQEFTYKVDSTYTNLGDGSMLWQGTITRSDGKKWEKRKTVAFVGDVHGRDVFGVSEAKVVKKNDTHKKHSNMCTTTTEGEWTITKDYETWRWERYFANPQNLDLTAETEIVFWTQQLTFKDPETGWTLTTKPLVKNCVITQDEIIYDASAPKIKQDGDHDHDYTYVGTHILAVINTLDGNFFYTSIAPSCLLRW